MLTSNSNISFSLATSETELFAVNPWTSHYWFFSYFENHLLCRHLDVSSFTMLRILFFSQAQWHNHRNRGLNLHQNRCDLAREKKTRTKTVWISKQLAVLRSDWLDFEFVPMEIRLLFILSAAVCQIRTVQSTPHTNRAIKRLLPPISIEELSNWFCILREWYQTAWLQFRFRLAIDEHKLKVSDILTVGAVIELAEVLGVQLHLN